MFFRISKPPPIPANFASAKCRLHINNRFFAPIRVPPSGTGNSPRKKLITPAIFKNQNPESGHAGVFPMTWGAMPHHFPFSFQHPPRGSWAQALHTRTADSPVARNHVCSRYCAVAARRISYVLRAGRQGAWFRYRNKCTPLLCDLATSLLYVCVALFERKLTSPLAQCRRAPTAIRRPG